MTCSNRPTILYAVRHGETEWNRDHIAQGHLDSPLTELGHEQAARSAKALVGLGIEFIYSSDLGRALRTAAIIGKILGLKIRKDERLRERALGVMQGLTWEQFAEKHPEDYAAFNSRDPECVMPGGESARELMERTVQAAESYAGNHPGQCVLVVAHGGVVKSYFHHALGIPLEEPRRYSLFNAAINRFSISEGKWTLDTWGERGHMDEVESLDEY